MKPQAPPAATRFRPTFMPAKNRLPLRSPAGVAVRPGGLRSRFAEMRPRPSRWLLVCGALLSMLVGAPAATPRLLIGNLGVTGSTVRFPGPRLSGFPNQLFFLGRTSPTNLGLWRTDGGTSQPPVLVRDLGVREPASLAFHGMGVLGDQLYFVAIAEENLGFFQVQTAEWWTSDGTADGTRRIRGLGGYGPFNTGGLDAVESGGRLYFIGQSEDLLGGYATLWRSDGTESGTIFLHRTSLTGLGIRALAPHGKGVLFVAPSRTFGRGYTLWSSDGTPQGTRMVNDSPSTSWSNGVSDWTLVGSDLHLFLAHPSFAETQLWRTDGTADGTRMLLSGPAVHHVVSLEDRVCFVVGGRALHRSDGTPSGTALVRTNFAKALQRPSRIGNELWFGVRSLEDQIEIWRSDGTEPGTTRVMRLAANPLQSLPDDFLRAGDDVYFRYTTNTSPNVLWKLDPSLTRASPIVERSEPFQDGHFPGAPGYALLGRSLVYHSRGRTTGDGLWALDLEASEPVPARILAPRRVGDGFRFELQGPPAATLRLDRAGSVLGPWSVLTNLTTDATGQSAFEEPATSGAAFYRLAQP